MNTEKVRVEFEDVHKFICNEMLKNNNGYFELMGIMISYFRSHEKNEIEVVFSHKVLYFETYKLIHQQNEVFKDLCKECNKIKGAISMIGLV